MTLDARAVKHRLYSRHPAIDQGIAGPWTCLEEWRGIDLLAIGAWGSVGYRRIGYEVKVSRSDLRRELLAPHKRARNVDWCNEFYFAVPAGLLTDAELAYEEPDWEPADFMREPCPDSQRARGAAFGAYYGQGRVACRRGKVEALLVGPLERRRGWRPHVQYVCPTCRGKGYMAKSRVELEAPTLWVPKDVGLVLVDGRGTITFKKSPRRKEVPALNPGALGQMIRWVSMRPDPRHYAYHQRRAPKEEPV